MFFYVLGTENVLLAVGLGEACRQISLYGIEQRIHLEEMRACLKSELIKQVSQISQVSKGKVELKMIFQGE